MKSVIEGIFIKNRLYQISLQPIFLYIPPLIDRLFIQTRITNAYLEKKETAGTNAGKLRDLTK